MLNWIVWNETVFFLNAELNFLKELIICLKMDLALNNLQRLICHKNNQPTNQPTFVWPARTYIQQLCEDTGCSPEDLPEAMNDREKWRERVRDIRASGTTWWWSRGINIVNWITVTRKSDEHLHTTYENTGQLFRPY